MFVLLRLLIIDMDKSQKFIIFKIISGFKNGSNFECGDEGSLVKTVLIMSFFYDEFSNL